MPGEYMTTPSSQAGRGNSLLVRILGVLRSILPTQGIHKLEHLGLNLAASLVQAARAA